MDAIVVYNEITSAVEAALGTTTDAASPSGTANAKLNLLTQRWAVASDTVQASSVAAKYTTNGILKVFSSLVGGTVRIKFTAYSNGGTWTLTSSPGGMGTGVVILGTGSNTSGVAYSVDVKVPPNNLIVLTGSATSGTNIYLSDVYLCFDISSTQTPLATNLID